MSGSKAYISALAAAYKEQAENLYALSVNILNEDPERSKVCRALAFESAHAAEACTKRTFKKLDMIIPDDIESKPVLSSGLGKQRNHN